MHFHYGLGVGHTYSHRPGILESLGLAPHLAAQTEGEFMGAEITHWQHPADDENEDDEEHVDVEESFPFEQ